MDQKTFISRKNFLVGILAVGSFIATATLIPSISSGQTDKVKASMAALKSKTEKLGAPKVEGNLAWELVWLGAIVVRRGLSVPPVHLVRDLRLRFPMIAE
jgi:hypothetical protein